MKHSVCMAIKSLRKLSQAFQRSLGEVQDEDTNRKDSVCMAIESRRKLSKALERVLGEVQDDATNRKDFVCKAIKGLRKLSKAFERALGEVWDAGTNRKDFVCKAIKTHLHGDRKPSKRKKRRFSWTRVIIVESKQPKVVFLTKRNAIGEQIAVFGKSDRPKSRYHRGFHRKCMSRQWTENVDFPENHVYEVFRPQAVVEKGACFKIAFLFKFYREKVPKIEIGLQAHSH